MRRGVISVTGWPPFVRLRAGAAAEHAKVSAKVFLEKAKDAE